MCVEHRRREPQASRHTSLSDSIDSLSTRASDCESIVDPDDIGSPTARPASRISLDDFILDGEVVPDFELVPGITYGEAELDALLRALSPVAPELPPALPPLSTTPAAPPSDSCSAAVAQSSMQPQSSGSQVVSLPSPEQRVPAFYEISDDVAMTDLSEFAQPLPSPLQFSAAGSEATSPVQPDMVDPRVLCDALPRLCISAQPGPKSFLKSTAEPPLFTVTLEYSGVLNVVSPVRAVCSDWVQLPPLEVELNKHHQASFSIVFPNRTPALRPIRVRFQVDVETPHGGSRTIESEPSQPLSLRTNISQFMKAERVVLMANVFPSPESKDFDRWDPVVASGIHQHFLACAGTRGLSASDFDFFHDCFSRQPLIRAAAVEDLFERWYGPMVKHFTDKNFRKLWHLRIIYGFVTRANATMILHDVSRQAEALSGISLVAFMEDSPLLTIASLVPNGGTEFRCLSPVELKQPFRDIISAMPHVSNLLMRGENDTFHLHAKRDVVAMLLPKKLHHLA